MSGFLSRDHTITPSWRARDADGRRIVCKSDSGVRLADLCRPWRRLSTGAPLEDDSSRIVLPSTSAALPLEMEMAGRWPSLRAFVSAGDGTDLVGKIAVASALTHELATVHACHVLHGRLSVDSVLVEPGTGATAIIDFTGAIHLAAGASLAEGTRGALAETLVTAPEGAGRPDRVIDHRTDLYALGCILYHLFAGRPVFPIDDRLALVHAHLAKRPDPLHEIADVPQALSDIVMALLKKQPDERYQRAEDLRVDLDRCLEDFRTRGAIERFSLRLKTRSAALADGDFLYGRDSQVQQLRDALTVTRTGRPQRLLVTGAPGVGKTVLCRHFADEVTRGGGRAAIGKFEQFLSNRPYLGIIRCFENLVDVLFEDAESAVDALARDLAAKLNENLTILCSLIPTLEDLVGAPLPREALSGFGARDRLAQSVLGFLSTIASPDRPVVLFLDDLQWADSASLDLLRRISEDLSGCVMLVGMCRFDRDAPRLIAHAAAALTAKDKEPLRADLIALTRSDVEDLLLDVFGPKRHQIEAASLIYAKTLGSPFFVCQFLKGLDDDAMLDPTAAWNIAKIAAIDGAADVVDFLSIRIASLDSLSRRILAIGACYGMSFDRKGLAELTGIEESVLSDRLTRMVADGFFATVAETYLFVHDRVREAAYRLAEDREDIHRRIGRGLLDSTQDQEAHAFDIARHLKAAGDLSGDLDLKTGYLRVAHFAARRAHAAAAFDLAREYAEAALDVTDIDQWVSNYDTMAATLLLKADSTVLRQDHERFDLEYVNDLARLQRIEDRLALALTRVMSLDARSRFEDALDAGRGALGAVGIDLPEDQARQREAVGLEFAAFQEAMAGRPPEVFFDLPPLADQSVAITMQILFRMAPSAHNTMQPELFAFMALRNANLMLRHGKDALGSGIVMTLALTLAGMTGDVNLADGFAQVAMKLDKMEGRRTPASVSFVYTYFFSHWLHPLESSLPSNLDGMRTAFEMGEVQFGCFHAAAYVMHLAGLGAPLPDVVQAGREHDRLIAGRFSVSSFHIRLEVSFAEALLGMTTMPTCLFKDRTTTVEDVMREGEDFAHSARGFFLARHLQLAYLFRDLDAAQIYTEALAGIFPAIERNFIAADAITFSLLADVENGHHVSNRFSENLVRLRRWSDLNAASFGCRLDLVLAELARRDGRSTEAISLYVQSLAGAKRHRFPHLAAVAAERAGRFFLSLGDDIAGVAYLKEASASYGHWGARAKVLALLDEIPHLRGVATKDQERERDRTTGFQTVLSAARSISAEIDLHRLLQTIMTSVQEVSGATSGALVLGHDRGYFVEVVARHGEGVIVCEAFAHPLASSQLVPRVIIAQVERDGAALVVNNAASSEFARDPYVRANAVVSILCVPLVGRGKLEGFIYLENNLTVGAFNPRSAQVLQVLAAQAAVALANARLFAMLDRARADLVGANEDLERKIDARTNELARARNLALEKAAEANRASLAEKSANEAKSRLLSVVSHEIRTPMNGILGMLQLLDRERLGAREKRRVDLAQQSGFALVKLIDGILDYSRLELGAEGAAQEDFDLRDLVDSSVEIFRSSAEAKRVRLDLDIIAPPGVVLRSDARGIGRVLMNLVGNAVKFTSDGMVEVGIELLSPPDASSPVLRLQVSDTGIGISQEMQARIFEDFVQADASIARRFGGTGLGLAISHRIVSLLGGTLVVESDPGVGSVFEAEIPVSIGVRAAGPSAFAASSEPLSLLVVDDDAINREVASGLLERLGHTVACAENCETAIAAVQCCAFDAVILDLHMPDIDGIETARRLRLSTGTAPCPPVILLTADATEKSRQRCLDAGINRILAKPLRLDALVKMLSGLGEGESTALPEMSRESPIDSVLFAERCEMLGVPTMVRLIRQYQRNARATVEAIRSAASISDRRAVARLAHRLRSASGSLQFGEMEDVAHRLERAASDEAAALDDIIVNLQDARRRLVATAIGEIRALRVPAMAELA